jgi:hypothetical protein
MNGRPAALSSKPHFNSLQEANESLHIDTLFDGSFITLLQQTTLTRHIVIPNQSLLIYMYNPPPCPCQAADQLQLQPGICAMRDHHPTPNFLLNYTTMRRVLPKFAR